MKTMLSTGLRFDGDALLILDQQQLPGAEVWLECHSPFDMIAMIKDLKVRGAPLIGVAAALALARYVERGREISAEKFEAAARALREARPTAVNLMVAIDRLWAARRVDTDAVIAEAERIFDEDVAMCDCIANNGARLIDDGDTVLTHCNAGALATAGVGTALGVIRRAFELGKRIRVFVDETRPLLQGARLTAWELTKAGIPYTLICDNMAAGLMWQGRIHRCVVGADRIAVNGDFANKIGTYGVAAMAQVHGIPFYVAAPYTTVDRTCPTGKDIPIEQRSPGEVRGAAGSFGRVSWAPRNCEVYNPAFDVTPAQFVTAFVLDSGVYTHDHVRAGALKSSSGRP